MALLAATAVAVAANPGPEPNADAGHRAESRPAISISGEVAGLYPGAAQRVWLRLHNRSGRPRTVTSVRARALDAGPLCPARNVKAKEKRVQVRIPAGSQRRLGYRIGMIRHAADACQDLTFPIRYRARVR